MPYQSLSELLPCLLKETWKSPALMGGTGWMTFEEAEIYIRIEPRVAYDDCCPVCIVIANIATPEPFTGSGIFTRMVKAIREISEWTLYLEKAKIAFANSLIKNYGWRRVTKMDVHHIDLFLVGTGERTTPK